MKYILYKASGEYEILVREKPLEYKELSALVGGMIEFAPVDEGEPEMCMNEEGMYTLKPNPFIKPKYQEAYFGDIIVGEKTDKDGDFVGWDDSVDVEAMVKKPAQIHPALFEKGKRFTIVYVGDSMPMTGLSTLVATGERMNGGDPVFKEDKKGARKKFGLRVLKNKDTLIFEGDVPFSNNIKGDTSGGMTCTRMIMNGLINLAGDIDVIRDYVENKNINPWFTMYDRVIHQAPNEVEMLVFPNRFASCNRVAEMQEAMLKRQGVDASVGVGFQIASLS